VLERFFRGGTQETRTAGGLGLGLALARQIVAAHGGELVVASRPGEGTRFSFRLPTADGRGAGPEGRT
jgi:signal transduction histidine kinase